MKTFTTVFTFLIATTVHAQGIIYSSSFAESTAKSITKEVQQVIMDLRQLKPVLGELCLAAGKASAKIDFALEVSNPDGDLSKVQCDFSNCVSFPTVLEWLKTDITTVTGLCNQPVTAKNELLAASINQSLMFLNQLSF